jgi:hypothetical protein
MQEVGRCYLLFKSNSAYFNYITPLIEHHIKLGELDRVAVHKYYNWDDASLVTGYYDYVLRRLGKYGKINLIKGLQYGLLNSKKFPNYKEELRNLEDDLTDYFLYEMRKEPQEVKYESPL